jgi:DNA-binding protein YbaB
MSDQLGLRLLAQLERLRAEAEAVNARLTAGLNPDLRYIGRDADRLVQVTIDGLGRATDVGVSPTWRQTTDVPGLQQAMIAAIRDSERQRLEGWATAATTAQPAPATTFPPVLLASANSSTAELDDRSGIGLMRALLPLLEAAERQLDDLTPLFRKHLEGSIEISSPGGEIIVQVRAGSVTEIELRSPWIVGAGAGDVAHQVRWLLQTAYDRAWKRIGDFLPEELGALMAFVTDPKVMLHRLGVDI